ncbi:MAG: hypothetical protein UY02_C0033G0007 [Candidatus Giovannonibacteria bacterium GW2011_GWB1_47_6b]|uniref:Uncharacterized protein n=1 Tax=Candidatus Giovannonibacteria bacterium GW2011_GWB1_47_6b TaxID=1618655 RepID=A0A0G1W1A9_9BACT|nr:MAG: hypothetical protein UY02_C0033G0007 [Candidatus Giovannonibacteria bacterium GW2011_GWB1_47_6b]
MKNTIFAVLRFFYKILGRILPPIARFTLWVLATAIVAEFVWAGWQYNVTKGSDFLASFLR